LSSAVGLSARFPGISPPGYLVERDRGPEGEMHEFVRSGRLVDGGFVDNSGAETALLAARALYDLFVLKNASRQQGFNGKPIAPIDVDIQLYIIIIGGVGGVENEGSFRASATLRRVDLSALNELGTPVLAMLNSRKKRANMAVQSVYNSG